MKKQKYHFALDDFEWRVVVNCMNALPNGWLNADFVKTESYSQMLSQYSVSYKQFYGVLSVRMVSAEYLIAMKLRSGRKYKNDLSDVIGILAEHEGRNAPITMEQIKLAVENLYGCFEALPEDSRSFIESAMANGDFIRVYETVCKEEKRSKTELLKFTQDYPNVTNTENVDAILRSLKRREAVSEQVIEKKRRTDWER